MNRPKLKFGVLFAVTCALAVTWSAWPTSVTSAAGLQANYVALGDSIAFGLYAPLGRGYVPLYATALHNLTGLQVNLLPLGVPGWTSADLANALKTNAFFQLAVYSNNVITFNIGGNDLSRARSSFKAGTCGGADNQQCLRDAVTTFESNWRDIVGAILFLRHGRPTTIRTMDIYNPFVDEDRAAGDFELLNSYLTATNGIIHLTETKVGIPYARVYDAFNISNGTVVDPAFKKLLAFDHFHPNAAGHVKIAERLTALGFSVIFP